MNRKHIEIINKRQEEIERRLDRSWRPKSGGRVLRGGNIVYDVSSRMGGVSSGGLGLIVQLVKRLRVAERIDERVRVLKRHLPYRESDHVLNLIYNVMSGGVCLQDVKSRREDVSYLESVGARKIPAPSTEGDFLRRFKQEDVLALQEAFNESRLQVWQSQAAEMGKRATIDVDGTTAPPDHRPGAHRARHTAIHVPTLDRFGSVETDPERGAYRTTPTAEQRIQAKRAK